MKKLKGALGFFKRIDLLYRFMQDERVSRLKKIKIMACLMFGFMYFLSPLDIVPEVILGIGIVDDAVVILYILTIINEELDDYESNFGKISKTASGKNIIEIRNYDVKDEK